MVRLTLLFWMAWGLMVEVSAQMASPVGTWVLTSHVVQWVPDGGDEVDEIDSNVLNATYVAVLHFDAAGCFHLQQGANTWYGSWKLKRHNRKLKLKFAGGGGYTKLHYEPLDFNKSLTLLEHIPQLYQNLHLQSEGGISYYERLIDEANAIQPQQYVGKWRVTHRQLGKKKEAIQLAWRYEIRTDTSKSEGISKKWVTDNPKLKNNDSAILAQRWHPYRAQYYLEKGPDGQPILTGYVGKKIEILFLEKIEP